MATLIRSGFTVIYPGGDQPRMRDGHHPGYSRMSSKRIGPWGNAA